MASTVVETARLRLREWDPEDASLLQRICSDELVVEYLEGRPWSHDHAVAFVDDMRSRRSLGSPETWAVEEAATRELIGWCGFATTNAPWLRADQVIEVGWTLARPRWGHGFATEAANAVLALGRYDRSRVIAKCHQANARSEAVMRRIGMSRVGVVEGGPTRYTVYRF